MSSIVDRIEREAGVPGLASILAEKLDPTDLQSLLLEVYRMRAARRSPADVLLDHGRNRFVAPSPVTPARALEWELALLAELPPDFEAVTLSPVCPLGTSSVVAGVSQNWAVATSRNTEVVSDSSNVLALECALRRRKLLPEDGKSVAPVHLAASHRLLRTERFLRANSYAHFSTFVLCSAGRTRGGLEFELAQLKCHVAFYVRALRRWARTSACGLRAAASARVRPRPCSKRAFSHHWRKSTRTWIVSWMPNARKAATTTGTFASRSTHGLRPARCWSWPTAAPWLGPRLC